MNPEDGSRKQLNKTKRLVLDGLLSAIALIIFVIELQIPSLTPIPGIKLGLSNIVTLMAMFLLGPLDAFYVLFVRVFLGCLLSGQVMALAYSLAGGFFSFFLMLLLHKVVSDRQIFVCSVFCALAHNLGQILVAVLITETPALFYYLPVLGVSGIIAGTFTGLTAQFVIKHLKRIRSGL
ncbi:MAG: Gx transporter family protein [Lachnospiraceae bacterium]